MKRNRKIPWDEILRNLKGISDAESDAVLTAWLDKAPLNREVYNELAVLWESVRQEDMDFDADAAWEHVKGLTIRKNGGNAKSGKPKRRFSKWVAAAACIAAAVLFTTAGYLAAVSRPSDYLSIAEYTPLNGKSRMMLSDGTEICLRDGSTISLDNSQKTGQREVLLDGEGYFHVAKNEGRSFVVKSGNVEICVYGTQFNVRTEKETGDVLVALQEGSVSLKTNMDYQMMTPGDIVRCSQDGTLSPVQGDVLQENCWTKNAIEFKGWTLGAVCDCLSRWYDVNIAVSADIANAYKYNFTLRNETLNEILSLMALASPIGYAFRLDGSVQVSGKITR